MHTSRDRGTTPLRVAARVRTLMRQIVTLLKDAAADDSDRGIRRKSVDMLYTGLKAFLEENETLALRIKKREIAFGDQVVYVPIGRTDILVRPLYTDGVRKLTFNRDLTIEELDAFVETVLKAGETDPYESDLVTALWDMDFANIAFEAEEVYLERDEMQADFLLTELGLASGARASLEREVELLREEDIENFRSQVIGENDSKILARSSAICLEILETAVMEDTFRMTAHFLGEICDWLVSVREFMPASSIVSDLRAIAQKPDVPKSTKQAIADVIRKRGNRDKLHEIECYIEELTDAKMEELFCYLGQMDPVAVEPLCHMLAEAQTRRVRYMLARVISIVAKDSIERLAPFLKDERWYVVRNIAMILGMIATEGALPYLKQVAGHGDARVRREVARALGRVKSPEGLETLRRLADDENKMIRLAAASAAGVIGGDAAKALLEDAILDEGFETKAMDEQRRFMEVYGVTGNGAADFLIGIIEGKQRAASENTRACAAYGLAAAGGSAAKNALQAILASGDGPIRYAASDALSMLEWRVNVFGRDRDGGL
jgi:HEAT repeat protein